VIKYITRFIQLKIYKHNINIVHQINLLHSIIKSLITCLLLTYPFVVRREKPRYFGLKIGIIVMVFAKYI